MTEQALLALLRDMTLEEKAAQLTQVSGAYYVKDAQISGTVLDAEVTEEELGMMGTTLNVCGARAQREVQTRCMALQPHHIPMVFMMDVIHGYRTVFPIPLAMGAAMDPALARAMMETAAREASADGIHVAFSPMLDLVRDPRWGRVMESVGEDPHLAGVLGRAMVLGLQGEGEKRERGRVSACVKHYAAYGAPEGGRDYRNAELSEHTLREFYLPAYRAAVDAGADMVMASFQTLNGLPGAASPHLLGDILRGEWGFDGVIITDWGAVAELVAHGLAADLKEAAYLAFTAGADVDMCSMAYFRCLPALVREGRIREEDLDRSVMRMLRLKNRLGLFEDPFRGADEAGEVILCEGHRALARRAVRESLVLLKNGGETPLLPLDPHRTAALIGPYVEEKELISAWSPNGVPGDTVTVGEAAGERKDFSFTFAPGCRLWTREDLIPSSREARIPLLREGAGGALPGDGEDEKQIGEAAAAARAADTAVVFLGEHRSMSGEGASRGSIRLPENQLRLLRRVHEANPNVVCVVFGGRPLELTEVCGLCRALVIAWLPGTEGGHGVMDLLTGRGDFSGRLPMSFPVSAGQIPVYYNQLRTGRPKDPVRDRPDYCTAYLDTPNRPLFPFGFGLSRAAFAISPVHLDQTGVSGKYGPEDGETVLLTASCRVRNTSPWEGTCVLQLYLRDDVSTLARPERELKGFLRLPLQPGEEKEASFAIRPEMLSFYGTGKEKRLEKGSFTVWIGPDSECENCARFTLG